MLALFLDVYLNNLIYCVVSDSAHVCTQHAGPSMYRCTSACILLFLAFYNKRMRRWNLSFVSPRWKMQRERNLGIVRREGGWLARSSQLNSLYIYIYIYIFSTPFWLINFDYSQEKNWHYSVFFLLKSGGLVLMQRTQFPVAHSWCCNEWAIFFLYSEFS